MRALVKTSSLVALALVGATRCAGPGDASAVDSGTDSGSTLLDGGSSDAGRQDAGGSPGDAGMSSDAGPLAPPCLHALCEDFEEGPQAFARDLTSDGGLWKLTAGSGNTFDVQTGRVASGQYAGHFHLADAGGSVFLTERRTAPVFDADGGTNHVYGRAHMFLTGTPGFHTWYINAGPANTAHLEIGSYQSGWQLTFWGNNGELPWGSNDAVPLNRWFCLRWSQDNAGGQMRISVDGAPDQGPSETRYLPYAADFSEVMFGIHPYGVSPRDVDLYVDDIALDTRPFAPDGGCS